MTALFTLTIRASANLGTRESERQVICQMLDEAKQVIGSHRDPQPLMYDGKVIGEYEFGARALNSNTRHSDKYR